ncbi:MAG: hypothetical protein QOJ10_639 [Chloroflexota bacterium]|nr:hypothetical protein [Chloroflexota bacterium]
MREPNTFAQRDALEEPDTVFGQESDPLAEHQSDSVSGSQPLSGYEPDSVTRRELDSVADRVALARELPE